MGLSGNEKLSAIKDDDLLSGFTRLLRDKLIEAKSTWDISINAAEKLDDITDSSIGLAYGVICIIDPKPDTVITMEQMESLTKESIIENNGVKNLFELYDRCDKKGTIDAVFSR